MDFILKDEFIPLCNLLKACNLVMSGGEGKEVIAQGLVNVDGEIETRKRCKIRAGQVVEFQEETIRVFAADTHIC
jgi:ribosome-associated protein